MVTLIVDTQLSVPGTAVPIWLFASISPWLLHKAISSQ